MLSHDQQHRPGRQPSSQGPSYHFNLGLPSTPRRRKFRCGDCWLIKLSELVFKKKKKKKGSLKIYIYIYLKYIKMTNSHNPQGLISQQRMLQTSSQNALRWMGWVGGSILPFKGMFYARALVTGRVLQRAHFQNSFVNKANLLNHLAHSDTKILKMAGFRVEHGKHRSDDTQDPSHHRAAKSLPEALFFNPWEEFYFKTNEYPYSAGFLRACVSVCACACRKPAVSRGPRW